MGNVFETVREWFVGNQEEPVPPSTSGKPQFQPQAHHQGFIKENVCYSQFYRIMRDQCRSIANTFSCTGS